MLKKILHIIKWTIVISFSLLVLLVGGLYIYLSSLSIEPPSVNHENIVEHRVEIGNNFHKIDNNWLKKNEFGLWEMYVEGEAYQRGRVIGMLSRELIRKQEDVFINTIKDLIPSDFYLGLLKYIIIFFNKDIKKYIPEEYQKEIYGLSLAASHKYDFIGSPYERILNYHGAHDIGHNLQNMHLVGCTSFGIWNERTIDSSMIIGRNFDFYFGDEFAKNKIVCFINPDKGNKFAMITWGGMIGAVSGMNEHGLTVTINAAKSDFSLSGKTPVSLVARSVLQYASNIKQAYDIINNAEIFVSESFLIGSASDRDVIVIEKSNSGTAVYDQQGSEIICTNHFQSNELKSENLNKERLTEGISSYRYERTYELLHSRNSHDVVSTIDILRNPFGKKDNNIGIGNEKAINQLITHHSVVFKPEKRLMWVSTSPFQLGKYVCYDLNRIFSDTLIFNENFLADERGLLIPEAQFLSSKQYKDYISFKKQKKKFIEVSNSLTDSLFSEIDIIKFIKSNPEYYLTYYVLGEYYSKLDNDDLANKYYKIALTKEIPGKSVRESIIELLNH